MPNGSHLGNVIQVAVDGNVIGCARNRRVSRRRSEIELKCISSGDYSDFAGGTKEVEITLDGFVHYDATYGFEQLVDAWEAGTDLVDVAVEPPTATEPIWTWPTMALLDIEEDLNVDEGHAYNIRLKAREAGVKTAQV